MLVGKDGGAKRVALRPITPGELKATIDAMPMRREEMRQVRSEHGTTETALTSLCGSNPSA